MGRNYFRFLLARSPLSNDIQTKKIGVYHRGQFPRKQRFQIPSRKPLEPLILVMNASKYCFINPRAINGVNQLFEILFYKPLEP